MISHLVPYEQVFISVTLSMDEATAISDALSLLEDKDKSLSGPAGELRGLLENGIERAVKLQERRAK